MISLGLSIFVLSLGTVGLTGCETEPDGEAEELGEDIDEGNRRRRGRSRINIVTSFFLSIEMRSPFLESDRIFSFFIVRQILNQDISTLHLLSTSSYSRVFKKAHMDKSLG